MNDSKWERWGALGGVLFAVIVAVSAAIPGSPPKTSDSSLKILHFLEDNGDAVRISAYLGGLAVIPLFWWLGSVWRLMRRSEGGSPRLAVVSLAGAVFAAVMATIGAILLAVLPIVGARAVGSVGVRFFYILASNLTVATEFGAAVFIGAFSVVIIRSKALPVIMGWLGVLIALVMVVGCGIVGSTNDTFFYISFTGFIAFLIWAVIVSILMFVRHPTAETAAPAPATSPA